MLFVHILTLDSNVRFYHVGEKKKKILWELLILMVSICSLRKNKNLNIYSYFMLNS